MDHGAWIIIVASIIVIIVILRIVLVPIPVSAFTPVGVVIKCFSERLKFSQAPFHFQFVTFVECRPDPFYQSFLIRQANLFAKLFIQDPRPRRPSPHQLLGTNPIRKLILAMEKKR